MGKQPACLTEPAAATTADSPHCTGTVLQDGHEKQVAIFEERSTYAAGSFGGACETRTSAGVFECALVTNRRCPANVRFPVWQ
jgi:hypothetical protein